MTNESTRNVEATRWSVTVNLPDDHDEDWLQNAIVDIAKLYDDGEIRYGVGQYERGQQDQRLHLQIYLILKDQHRGIWLSNRITGAFCVNKRATDDKVMRRYCCNADKIGYVRAAFEHGQWPLSSKQGDRSDMADLHARIKAGEITSYEQAIEYNVNLVARQPNFTKDLIEREVLSKVNAAWVAERALSQPYVPKVWQFWLRKYLIEEPRDDRKIIFICDPAGGGGKSRFIEEFLCEFPSSSKDLTAGRAADLACALEVACMRVLFIDITRSKNEYAGHIYDFAENVKSGKVFAPKFMSTMKRFPPPHVVVFTNDVVDLGGRPNGKTKWIYSARAGKELPAEGVTEMPLSYDRYLWWNLGTHHKEVWRPSNQIKWGNSFPPFQSLSDVPTSVTNGSCDKIVPYHPPNVKTSGPEFNGDMAGDGPRSTGVNRDNPNRTFWRDDGDGWPHPRNFWIAGRQSENPKHSGCLWCMKRGCFVEPSSDAPETVWWKYQQDGAWFSMKALPMHRDVLKSRVRHGIDDLTPAFPPPAHLCDNEV